MNSTEIQYNIQKSLPDLKSRMEGDLLTDISNLLIYSTDASAYRESPIAVALPKTSQDILKLIQFANLHKITLIPRGAGTSLAGQVVGKGIVVDISRYMNRILEINVAEKWVRVQPGVILDELNIALKSSGLFFAPETSTSNRCMIGGMIGNNSSGLHSLIYGTTREHTLEIHGFLSDGSEVVFKNLDKKEFQAKCELQNLEGKIYRHIRELFADSSSLEKIDKEFPDKTIVRRNTGYALDELSDNQLFRKESSNLFNFCKLVTGSEGTLAFTSEAKLNLMPLPPPQKALVCVHFTSVMEAIRGNLIALKYLPGAVELMDDKILQLTRENIEQRKNRFFVKGDPGAILMIEFARESMEEIHSLAKDMEAEMRNSGLGYHFPVVTGNDIKKVWDLRKAGLGVLSNMSGDAKPVSVIEDTSVNPLVLEAYISDFNDILAKYKLECVYHAHISVGELHLRPILNLKDPEDVKMFRVLAEESARLVKKYRGSLSGEHGDGRLRGEFIPIMVGQEIYSWFREIKKTWDPGNVFNAFKIVNTPPMNSSLRYEPGVPVREIETIFDFSKDGGFMRSVEKCNGSADCRKTEIIGGTMCPSYMASRDEKTTTRARANILREMIINSKKNNPFNHKEIYEVLDLCLSCKACKSECPSNVDMAKLKAEFLQHYYDSNGIPLRTRLIAYISSINKLGMLAPGVFNFFATHKFTSGILKNILSFAPQRNIPTLAEQTLLSWSRRELKSLNASLNGQDRLVYLFVDEFTNYNDVEIGIKAIKLLNRLKYKVEILEASNSGRTFISKGLLRTARKIAIKNVKHYKSLITSENPLIGIEPSAILGFRDEYPELLRGKLQEDAMELAKNALMIDEFLAREIESGRISKASFTKEERVIKLHGHCQQKAIASTNPTISILSFPENYKVGEIKSGCCGMAGSFGYEKEHYDLSMKVGELVLFPAIRKSDSETIIAAPGTSCRHQIKDGSGRKALHPVVILYEALRINT
jgi:FAD/FMN-containing dehydrogenase/Fe-S oxidoreductase